MKNILNKTRVKDENIHGYNPYSGSPIFSKKAQQRVQYRSKGKVYILKQCRNRFVAKKNC